MRTRVLILSTLLAAVGCHTGICRPYALADLDANGIPPVLANVSTPAEWTQKRAEIEAVWQDYVGELPARPAPEVKVISEEKMEGYVRRKIVFATAYNDSIPAYLLIPDAALLPDAAPRAAMLALHPTNADGKKSIATPEGRKNRMYALELVQRGYIVLAPDDLTSGERIYPGRENFDSTPFYEQHPGWNTVAKNLVDHLQAMDVLSADPMVDPTRIGVIGHSFGAYNAYFLAGYDPRVKVVVSSCGVGPFTRTNNLAHWSYRSFPYTHFPRISEDTKRGIVPFEFNEIIALVAPRPQFFYAAEADQYFQNWKAVGECFADMRSLYGFLGQVDEFQSYIGVGKHDFPPDIRILAYAFLDRHLRPELPVLHP